MFISSTGKWLLETDHSFAANTVVQQFSGLAMIFLVSMVERWLLILLESLNNFKTFSNSFHNSIDFTVNISISKDMVVGARLDNPLPNGGFKTCSDVRSLFCKHCINTDSFWSPITGRTYKILDKRSCRKDNFCKFALSNLLGKQVISGKESTTTARPQRPGKSTSQSRNFSMWGVTNEKTLQWSYWP